MKSDLSSLAFRHERKYELPLEQIPEFEVFLRLHPELFREAYPPRWVNSLYFDTPDFTQVHRHVEGASRRAKLRVRWYGDLEGETPKPRLEAKIKVNNRNAKRSSRLSAARVELASLDSQARQWFSELKDKDPLKAPSRNQRAVALVRYRRRYRASADGRFRVTIDTDMQWYGPRPGGGGFMPAGRGHNAVVELKHDTQEDESVIASLFPMRFTRHSKYLRAVRSTLVG